MPPAVIDVPDLELLFFAHGMLLDLSREGLIKHDGCLAFLFG
jgi:hypothetical protein